MKKKGLFSSKDGKYLRNSVLWELKGYFLSHLEDGDEEWVGDLDQMLYPHTLLKKEWFDAAQATYDYYVSLPEVIQHHFQIGIYIRIPPSLTSNNIPTSLSLSDCICLKEPPNFLFSKMSREAVIKLNEEYGYRKIKIDHPFSDCFESYYCETLLDDYADPNGGYYEIQSYDRCILLI